MDQGYTIFPASTLQTITTTLFAVIASNIVVIIGVLALAVGVTFVTRHFHKSTKKIKA